MHVHILASTLFQNNCRYWHCRRYWHLVIISCQSLWAGKYLTFHSVRFELDLYTHLPFCSRRSRLCFHYFSLLLSLTVLVMLHKKHLSRIRLCDYKCKNEADVGVVQKMFLFSLELYKAYFIWSHTKQVSYSESSKFKRFYHVYSESYKACFFFHSC